MIRPFILISISAVLIAQAGSADDQPTPLNIPEVKYPEAAVKAGLAGECETKFDLTPAGVPINIEVTCTHPVFFDVAKDAITQLRYAPLKEGAAKPNRRISFYPLVFRIK